MRAIPFLLEALMNGKGRHETLLKRLGSGVGRRNCAKVMSRNVEKVIRSVLAREFGLARE